MRLGSLEIDTLAERLAGEGVVLDFGSLSARVRSDVPGLAAAIALVYGEYPQLEATGMYAITADLERRRGIHRLIAPQVQFRVDGEYPFDPFPADTHLPLMEWGLNWCVANRAHRFLLLHAGVVERDGRAVVLPALPGSGKSTLTAALMHRGFRLLSDEFGAVDMEQCVLVPLLRPVALKNESIDIIREFAPQARIGPSFPKTRKGTVAHLGPDRDSVDRRAQSATPALIVFPKFDAGSELSVEAVPKARAFVRLIANSFNYELLGAPAFDAANRLVARSVCCSLRYGRLDDAIAAIEAALECRELESAPPTPECAIT
jgi:HprK-related kinase A